MITRFTHTLKDLNDSRRRKDQLKLWYFYGYRLAARLGIGVIPLHYYSAEPSVHELAQTRDVWTHPLSLAGIDVDPDEQVRTLKSICLPYQSEYAQNKTYRSATEYGPGYGYIEAQALHAVVRHFRPTRVVEIGSGVSTVCTLEALHSNAESEPAPYEVVCIEPYPSPRLRELAQREETVRVIETPVQTAPMEIFDALERDDILFVDSSHVMKAGSDVIHTVLEILPRLKSGVIVHFHDIYLPYAYQRDVLDTFLHNNETPFLAAFLTYNTRFRILFSLSILHYERPAELAAVFPEYRPQAGWRGLRTERAGHFPSSLWLQVA